MSEDAERNYEKGQIEEINSYSNKEPGVVSTAMGYIAAPIGWLVNQVVPQSAIEGALQGADWLAKQMVDQKSVLEVYGIPNIEGVKKLSLKTLDAEADSVHSWAITYAAGEGAVAGWFGILSAPADIPALITLSIRTIRRIGLCYGYDGTEELDRNFVMTVLSEAGANSQAEKLAAWTTLRQLQVMIAQQAWKKLAEKAAESAFSKEAAIVMIRDLAKQLGINITKRKAAAAIPVVGMLTGAGINASYMADVGWAARRAFQRRWLADNNRWIDSQGG